MSTWWDAAGYVLSSDVREASGLAASRRNTGVLWTHDDSDGGFEVFAISETGVLLGTYSLGSGIAIDFEDIAVGPGPAPGVHYVYVGDIGDNKSQRSSVYVYRFPEPEVKTDIYVQKTLAGVERIELTWPAPPDGPAKRDSEAMFVDANGDLYLITKRLYPNHVYMAAYPQSTTTATELAHVATLPTDTSLWWITAADMTADGMRIAIRNDTGVDQVSLWYREPSELLYQTFSTGAVHFRTYR